MTADATAEALQRATDALQAGDLDGVRTWSQWAYVHATDAWRAERANPVTVRMADYPDAEPCAHVARCGLAAVGRNGSGVTTCHRHGGRP